VIKALLIFDTGINCIGRCHEFETQKRWDMSLSDAHLNFKAHFLAQRSLQQFLYLGPVMSFGAPISAATTVTKTIYKVASGDQGTINSNKFIVAVLNVLPSLAHFCLFQAARAALTTSYSTSRGEGTFRDAWPAGMFSNRARST
jgi:hypothetical protein